MSTPIRLRDEQLFWHDVEGEVVVLDLRDSTYFALNRTGSALWSGLIEGATREQLVARLTDRFEVDEPAARKDLDAFLADVGSRGFLAD